MRVATITSRRQFLRSFPKASLAMAGYARNPFTCRSYAHSALYSWAAPEAHAGKPREGAIEFESSDATLAGGFRWAKAQALAYGRNDGSIGPWYEASLPG